MKIFLLCALLCFVINSVAAMDEKEPEINSALAKHVVDNVETDATDKQHKYDSNTASSTTTTSYLRSSSARELTMNVNITNDDEELYELRANERELACTYRRKVVAMPGKRGIGFTTRPLDKPGNYEENMPKVIALNPYWNFNWGHERPPNQPDSLEFVPMVWGYYGAAGEYTFKCPCMHLCMLLRVLYSELCVRFMTCCRSVISYCYQPCLLTLVLAQ
jgi:hypothetical protein